jgi:hypothetical protein
MKPNLLELFGKSHPILDHTQITNVAAFLRRPVWIWFCCIPMLIFGSLSHAQPLSIIVSNALRATYVEAQGYPSTIYPPTSRTKASAVPISDEMDCIVSNYMDSGGVFTNEEVASANYFGVSASAAWVGNASATNQIWFSPVMDHTQSLEIQISTGVSASGSVSLFDLTANSTVWNYFWDYSNPNYPFTNNIPWNQNSLGNADFNVTTPFLASHHYQLTFVTACGAAQDSTSAQIKLVGLVIDPSTTPLSVQVSNALCTTYLATVGYPSTTYPPTSRLIVSAIPISDEMDCITSNSYTVGLHTNEEVASANNFGAFVSTAWVGNASATNQIWFSPVMDQAQTLEIQIATFAASASGSVGLFDLTANSTVWKYFWDYSNPYYSSNNIPWNPNSVGNADFNVTTPFLASHQYKLTMVTACSAADDSESSSVQLTGLQLVTPFQLTGTTISNGTPWFVLNGLGGNTYTIQTSSDLVNWASFSTNAEPSTGALLLKDATPSKPQQRFYRAVPWPSGSTFLSATAGRISPPFTITNSFVNQSVQTTEPTNGGLATYTFNITTPGNYVVQALVNAPNEGANSVFLNIDADPQSPTMISDIYPLTSGFAIRTLSWRGNGTDVSNQYIPKVFNLTHGTHQLVIRGREVNTQLKNISIVPYP